VTTRCDPLQPLIEVCRETLFEENALVRRALPERGSTLIA
jgi:hypothetical protein